MKHTVAILLIISVIICTLCGCNITKESITSVFSPNSSQPGKDDDNAPDGFSTVSRDVFEISGENSDPVSLTLGYDSLPSDNMKECYNRIDESIYFVTDEKQDGLYKTQKIVLEKVNMSEAQLRVVIAAYFADHPQVFWLDNNFEYASSESKTVLQFSSFMSADEIEKEAKKLTEQIQDILNEMPSELSEYDKEVFLHDALIGLCEYDDDVKNIEDNFRAFTATGALVEGSAVCEGYSRAFQYLLSLAGIESYCVVGTGEGELHMWNAVKIYDGWYYVDTTWDEDDDSGVCYDYFNLSETQLSYSHSINYDFSSYSDEEICGSDGSPQSFNIATFVCADDTMTYHRQKGVFIDGVGAGNKEKLTQGIVNAASEAQGEEFTLYIYIDTEYLDYDYAVNNIFYSGEYLVFYAIDDANERMYKSVDRDSVSIKKVRELDGVNVYLKLE